MWWAAGILVVALVGLIWLRVWLYCTALDRYEQRQREIYE